MLRATSRNYTRPTYALKCDIKKFFDSVDHPTLLSILQQKIKDCELMWLLTEIIESYPRRVPDFTLPPPLSLSLSLSRKPEHVGIPIGNLASQLFANIYLNEFDQFIKHTLKVKNYARYTDDFILIADNPNYLKTLLPPIEAFLKNHLHLELHPQKVVMRKFTQGIDFLGYVLLPHYRLLRRRTKNRMFRKLKQKIKDCREGIISEPQLQASFQSYLGVVSHSHGYKLGQQLKNYSWFKA